MPNTATTARSTTSSQTGAKANPRPQRLRWHPVRLLYIFVVTLVVGILYSEAQAILTDPSSALDPSQLKSTFFWRLALAYPAYVATASILAVGAAVLGWRLDRRYAAAQAEEQREETVAAVVERVQAGVQLSPGGKAIPRDLPARAPGFVGRQQDLSEITTALRQGQAVAVVGMGGLGKSSLAAEAVYALAQEPQAFPGGITWARCDDRSGLDGVIWIEDQLLSTWGASLPPEAVARAATPEEGLALREQALRKRLGASDGQAQPSAKLVLLDNVEPGLPLGRLLDTLAPVGIASLVTTRVEPTSQHIRLLNLEVLDAQAGARLFAERYTDRGGKWDAARDTEATSAVVEVLGGLPLAIELAAARAARTRLPLPTLADELRAPDALARLNDPRDPSSGVRYSLRKTLLALSPSQRARFAALGLPDGPDWPLLIIERMFAGVPAAQEGVAPARDDLEALVAYSLVGLSAPAGSDAPRVRLHPLVRELAREEWGELPEDAQRATLAGLLAGVHDWVTEYRQAVPVLARDEDLIAGTLRAAAAQRVDLPVVIGTITAFDSYLFFRNLQLREELGKVALASARAIGDRRSELRALRILYSSANFLGKDDDNGRYTQEALRLARALGDLESLIGTLTWAASLAADQGRVEDARKLYEEVLPLASTLDTGTVNSDLLISVGNAAAALRDYPKAASFFERALASARAEGDATGKIIALHNLAESLKVKGDVTGARRHHEEALAIARSVGGDRAIAVSLENLGEVALRMGDVAAASSSFGEALHLFETAGDAQMAAHVRGNFAVVQGEIAR